VGEDISSGEVGSFRTGSGNGEILRYDPGRLYQDPWFVCVFCGCICCLGLLGIVSYTVDIRLKEISIRRIMGAPNLSIVYLLSGEFMVVIAIAFAVGMPIAYVLNSFWLENLAYHTSVGAGTFITTVIIMLIMFAVIVLSQIGRALRAKPGETLKAE